MASSHRRQHRPKAPKEDEVLKAQVLTVVENHAAYGYRWIGVELCARGVTVNHKRLRRVLNLWDLALSRKVARPRPSGVRRILRTGRGKLGLVQGKKMEPLEALSTDFTEIRYAGGTRKAYLMAMVGVGSAWAPGWPAWRADRRGLVEADPRSGSISGAQVRRSWTGLRPCERGGEEAGLAKVGKETRRMLVTDGNKTPFLSSMAVSEASRVRSVPHSIRVRVGVK